MIYNIPVCCRTQAGWQVRVSGAYDFIDTSSDHLFVWAIPWSEYMDRRSHINAHNGIKGKKSVTSNIKQ